MNNNENLMNNVENTNNNLNSNLNNNLNNENKKTVTYLSIAVLIVTLIVVTFILGIIKNEEKEGDNDETSSSIGQEEVSSLQEGEKPITDIQKYVDLNNVYAFYKNQNNIETENSEGFETNVELLLFKDDSYIMTFCSEACTAKEGTYEFKENELLLNQTKRYGSDACYYNDKSTSTNIVTRDEITLDPQHGSDNITIKRASLLVISDVVDRYIGNEVELIDCTDKLQ